MSHSRRHVGPHAAALLLLAACCFVACATHAAAQTTDRYGRWENGVSEPWYLPQEADKSEVAALQTRWRLIAEEDRAGWGAWAGDYFVGDETHGTYLRWSPGGGFVLLKVNKCAAQVDDFSYGRVVASPSLVTLVPERAMRPRGEHDHGHAPSGSTYVPVVLRGSRLLVPEGEMNDFGDYVAGLGEYNSQQFYYYVIAVAFFSKLGADEAGGDEMVVLPPGYERFLKQPLTARITAVGRRSVKREYADGASGAYHTAPSSVLRVTVSVGRRHGARRGMMLRVLETGEEIHIERVGEQTSTAVLVRSLNDNGAETYFDGGTDVEKVRPRVVAGWRLTTSPF